jgi:hypothetical protein
VNEIMHFAVWVRAEHAEWFTEYGKEKYDVLVVLIENEKKLGPNKKDSKRAGWQCCGMLLPMQCLMLSNSLLQK